MRSLQTGLGWERRQPAETADIVAYEGTQSSASELLSWSNKKVQEAVRETLRDPMTEKTWNGYAQEALGMGRIKVGGGCLAPWREHASRHLKKRVNGNGTEKRRAGREKRDREGLEGAGADMSTQSCTSSRGFWCRLEKLSHPPVTLFVRPFHETSWTRRPGTERREHIGGQHL